MIEINLLPPELKLKRIQTKKVAAVISKCIVIVLVFAVVGVIAVSLKSTIALYLDVAQKDNTNQGSNLDRYNELKDLALFINDRSKTADAIEKDRAAWSQIMQELANCVPQTVQISSLSADEKGQPNFILQGKTTGEREIIQFKSKLEDSSFFKDVNFKSSSLTEGQANQLNFTIDFNLEKKHTESKEVAGASTKGVVSQ